MSTEKDLKIVIREGYIALFGIAYYKRGENWVVPTDLGIHAEVSPATDNLKDVEQCIVVDRKAGKADQINHVLINSCTASLAYLEGTIPKEAFEKAEETEDYIQITLQLAGQEYPVRIYPKDTDMLTGTYTKEGEIV
jgi:hypothetical protein